MFWMTQAIRLIVNMYLAYLRSTALLIATLTYINNFNNQNVLYIYRVLNMNNEVTL